MPNFTGTVSEGEIVEIVAYIKSLATGRDGGATDQIPAAPSQK